MKTTFKYLAVILIQLAAILPVKAGCNYMPGAISVTGNFAYDSISNTYFANQGDTLLLYYTGTYSGGDYEELHYFNDSLIGSRLDTIQVIASGIYKVEMGCFGVDYTFTCILAFSSCDK